MRKHYDFSKGRRNVYAAKLGVIVLRNPKVNVKVFVTPTISMARKVARTASYAYRTTYVVVDASMSAGHPLLEWDGIDTYEAMPASLYWNIPTKYRGRVIEVIGDEHPNDVPTQRLRALT